MLDLRFRRRVHRNQCTEVHRPGSSGKRPPNPVSDDRLQPGPGTLSFSTAVLAGRKHFDPSRPSAPGASYLTARWTIPSNSGPWRSAFEAWSWPPPAHDLRLQHHPSTLPPRPALVPGEEDEKAWTSSRNRPRKARLLNKCHPAKAVAQPASARQDGLTAPFFRREIINPVRDQTRSASFLHRFSASRRSRRAAMGKNTSSTTTAAWSFRRGECFHGEAGRPPGTVQGRFGQTILLHDDSRTSSRPPPSRPRNRRFLTSVALRSSAFRRAEYERGQGVRWDHRPMLLAWNRAGGPRY